MAIVNVTRAQLKTACDTQNWDLLDLLLEHDSSQVNDNALYTDTWGIWWGMLFETVRNGSVEGVKVLLKHGAQADLASWGDDIAHTPLELACDKPAILDLLNAATPIDYHRTTDPAWPQGETLDEQASNRQGEIRDQSGLVFPIDRLEPQD